MSKEQSSHLLSHCRSEAGFTLIELLVGMTLSLIIVGSALAALTFASRTNSDNSLVVKAEEKARTVLDMLAFDVRMAGGGMPLTQTDFSMSDSSLDDAPFPIIPGSTTSSLTLRRNRDGSTHYLSQAFDPDGDVSVVTADDVTAESGDLVYISDALTGGHDGYMGTINSVVGGTLSLDSDYIASASAQFPQGSSLSVVQEVTYSSGTDWSGVERRLFNTSMTVASGTTVSFEYLDTNGNSLGTTLSESEIANELAQIRITVQARSSRVLSNNSYYIAEAKEIVSPRNIVISRG